MTAVRRALLGFIALVLLAAGMAIVELKAQAATHRPDSDEQPGAGQVHELHGDERRDRQKSKTEEQRYGQTTPPWHRRRIDQGLDALHRHAATDAEHRT